MIAAIRRNIAFAGVLAVVAALYFASGPSDRIGQLGGDWTWYLMMAGSYSPFSAHDAVYAAAAQESRFPPLYPLLLALVGAAENLRLAYTVNVACLVFALGALYAWCLELGIARPWSLAAALVVAMLPGSYLLALYPQSEYLYLALSLAALWLLARHARTRCSRDLIGAALLIAAACLTRSIGVALFAPLALAVLRERRLAGFATIGIAIAPLLGWQLVHQTPFGYGRMAADIFAQATPAWWWVQSAGMWTALRYGFGHSLVHFGGMFAPTQALAALLLAAALWRCVCLAADGVYVGAYLAMLTVWPFPEESTRFVWPIIPVGLAQGMLLASRVSARVSGGRGYAQTLFAGVLAVLVLPALAIIVARHGAGEVGAANRYVAWYDSDPAQAALAVRTTQAIVEGLQNSAQIVPAGECVFSTKPDLLNFYARRAATLPPVAAVPQAEFERALDESQCHWLAMMIATQRVYPEPMYPLQRLGNNALIVDARGFTADGRDYSAFTLTKLQ
jgi:hypothetical protein